MISLFLFVAFNTLLFAGMPVTFAMGTAAFSGLILGGYPLEVIPQILARSAVNQSILAVPLFILAGNLMNATGLTERIFDFARSMAGHFRGGLACVNILASLLFAGISGSAAADCAGLGVIEIDAMNKAGYRKPFSAAVTLASSCVGPIIPPSIPLILYGVMAEVSIARLFLGGFLPGLLIGLLLMGMVYFFVLSGREPCVPDPKASPGQRLKTFGRALPAFLAPLFILYGMTGGLLAPGEAGAAAALCAAGAGAACGGFSLPKWRKVVADTALTSAHILLLLAMAGVMGYLLTQERTPAILGEYLLSLTGNRTVLLLLMLSVVLFFGCFMSGTAALILLAPVFLPAAKALGVDLIHFGLVLTLGLTLGVATPPVGIGLFIVREIADISLEELIRATLPFLFPLLAALLLVIFFPGIVLFLPHLLMG